jgi:hypothetical protein
MTVGVCRSVLETKVRQVYATPELSVTSVRMRAEPAPVPDPA